MINKPFPRMRRFGMYRAGQFCVQRRFVLVWKNGGESIPRRIL